MKVLLIESDRATASTITEKLKRKGHRVSCVYDSETVAKEIECAVYDILIIDDAVPKLNAFEVIKRLRVNRPVIPIILLSDRGDIDSRLSGYDSGTDYYITKPIDAREIAAIIKIIIRHKGKTTDECSFGNTILDLDSCELINGDKRVRLSDKELSLMRLLLQTKGQALTKEIALARVWGADSNAKGNSVEVYIGFIRKKLKSIDSNIWITVNRRIGYFLEIQSTEGN